VAEVTYLDRFTPLHVPVGRVLDGAQDCTEVLLLGTAADGSFYVAASTGDAQQLLFWVERFKYNLLSGEYPSCP
jgi:hypothetical protein